MASRKTRTQTAPAQGIADSKRKIEEAQGGAGMTVAEWLKTPEAAAHEAESFFGETIDDLSDEDLAIVVTRLAGDFFERDFGWDYAHFAFELGDNRANRGVPAAARFVSFVGCDLMGGAEDTEEGVVFHAAEGEAGALAKRNVAAIEAQVSSEEEDEDGDD